MASGGTRRAGRLGTRVAVAVLAAVVLAVLVGLAATSPRPPLRGEGIALTTVWLVSLAFVAALGLLIVVVLLAFRERLPGGAPRPSPSRTIRTVAFLVLAAWAITQVRDIVPPISEPEETPTVAPTAVADDTAADADGPLTTSPAAIGASLAAVALLGLALFLRRQRPEPPVVVAAATDTTGLQPVVAPATDPDTVEDPRQAVLAAYAAARRLVSPLVDDADYAAPLALARRLDPTPVGPAFRDLTARYLPARFSPMSVDESDRHAALDALERIRAEVAT